MTPLTSIIKNPKKLFWANGKLIASPHPALEPKCISTLKCSTTTCPLKTIPSNSNSSTIFAVIFLNWCLIEPNGWSITKNSSYPVRLIWSSSTLSNKNISSTIGNAPKKSCLITCTDDTRKLSASHICPIRTSGIIHCS